MGTHACEQMQAHIPEGKHVVLVVTHTRRVHAHEQNTHRARTSPPDFDTLQTHMHTCTLETWLKGIENTRTSSSWSLHLAGVDAVYILAR